VSETNRDKALRGEPVIITLPRLKEMQEQAIRHEGHSPDEYHWHWAAVVNELLWLRAHSALQFTAENSVESK
jgi:hypothetical protein